MFSLLSRIIVIVLASVGVTVFNNQEHANVAQNLKSTEEIDIHLEIETKPQPVGGKCEDDEDCIPCANENDRAHCSVRSPGEHKICWCKEHRLYPGQTCLADEECKPKSCVSKGEVVLCGGHPRVCKCKAHHEGKDQCLGESDCPACENKNETSRCSGTPRVCKPCRIRYLDVGEKCTDASECLYCADQTEKAFCAPEESGGPSVCRCRKELFPKGHQCLVNEDCTCKDEHEVAECHGHPRICKCKPRSAKNVGEKCHRDEECKPCANEKDTPHCADAGEGKDKICKCKLHRLYPGESCFSKEECKPKSCLSKKEDVVCGGHPQVCKCKPHNDGGDECLVDAECPACKNKNETSRCAGEPKVCKKCEIKYLRIGEECTKDSECLHCADKKDTAFCSVPLSAKSSDAPKVCKCKEHRFTKGHQCLADEECKCEDKDEVGDCGGHPRVCKCIPRRVKRVGEKCHEDEECKPCANEKDTPRCSEGEPGEHKICKCKLHRLYPGERCFATEECKPKSCLRDGKVVECGGHPQVCKCKHHHAGKDKCLDDLDCPECENEGEVSRCSGTPKECKPCGIKYLKVGEECRHSHECLYCADDREAPFCSAEDEGGPKICKCMEHRFHEGHQCLADEECKCTNKEHAGECGGHPRVCKCKPKRVKKVGEKCHLDEDCKPCADERDTPHCSEGESGEHKICKCKLHRLYPGERCFAAEECKPKSCLNENKTVECAGHPQVCKCKAHHEGKDKCLNDEDCPLCEREGEVSRCSGTPKECKPCGFKYLKVGEECEHSHECLYCADDREAPFCSADDEGGPKICKCKEHRFHEGHQCLAGEECKCSARDLFAECYGHPQTCKCTERGIKKVGDKCYHHQECKPCADEKDTPHCSAGGPGEPKICKCKLHRLYLFQRCFAAEECKPKPCLAKGEKVECTGHPQVCKCKADREGEDKCLDDADCPACEKEGEKSRCSGSPKECKPCGVKYLKVGEKCEETSQCLFCADNRDTPFCSAEADDEAKICKCKEHRFHEGEECLADEECKCAAKDFFAECYGHPRTCKCSLRQTKAAGEKCYKDEECMPCEDTEHKPHCSTGESGKHKICKCKLGD